jgi:hypothetical protein
MKQCITACLVKCQCDNAAQTTASLGRKNVKIKKVPQIGSRDIRQQSGASANVAKPRNGNATQDRIVRRARDILCKGREARRNHLQVQ